jgi:S1-C subfamily serine protease
VRRIQGRLRGGNPLVPGRRLKGTGTGFFISASGQVVTNHHVIDNCAAVSVTPAGGKAGVAQVLASDQALDLAWLRAPITPPGFARFRKPARLLPGEDVAVVGYPLHGRVAIKPIFVTGHIYVGNGPRPKGRFAIKIDIRRGNSGGPVLDRSGRVVGVVVAKINTPGLYAATGKVVRDLGFGIPEPVVLGFLRSHGAAVTMAAKGGELGDTDLFDLAHKFIAQIGCWR